MEIIIGILIVIVIGIAYLIFENKNLAITNYIIEQERVPKAFDGMRFVCLTDLHNNRFGKDNKRLLAHIHSYKPDVILIAGDMIVARETKKLNTALSLLKELSNHYPVYYSPGNHELKLEMWELNRPKNSEDNCFITYLSEIKKCGVSYLDNDSITIEKGKDRLQITGLNLPLMFFYKGGKPVPFDKRDMSELVGTASNQAYQILLAHMPNYFETYAEWGADFVLSGHVHGGIMRIPYLGGVISPQYEIFPKYDSGIFTHKKSIMLLSRGLGTHTIPVRVLNRPELICMELKKK